jgi:DNA-binding PucR family transcriptional regulator
VIVLIGTVPQTFDADQFRRAARKAHSDVLIGIHGDRLIVVLGHIAEQKGETKSFSSIVNELEPYFGGGNIVIGPTIRDVSSATISAKAALSAYSVIRNSTKAERVVHADDLLAERALAGDAIAKQTLIEKVYEPLAANSSDLLETLTAYLDSGRSLEGTAKLLFVHPNTVRYRLKRISDVIGWDATGAHEAFVLQVAMVLGSLGEK